MPSSIASGPKFRSIRGGGKYKMVPDFVESHRFAAADLSGANSGFVIFTVPANTKGAIFLGATYTQAVAGTGTIRIKKILAGNTSAPGAAADANNVDLTAAVNTTATANTPVDITPVATAGVQLLAAGDRLVVASSAGLATVAGASLQVRLAWL